MIIYVLILYEDLSFTTETIINIHSYLPSSWSDVSFVRHFMGVTEMKKKIDGKITWV